MGVLNSTEFRPENVNTYIRKSTSPSKVPTTDETKESDANI